MKKLFTLLLVLITCSVSAIDMGPYDPGAARKSDLDLKLDLDGGNAPTTIPLINASFTGDIDVAGDVGVTTISGTAYNHIDFTGSYSQIIEVGNGQHFGATIKHIFRTAANDVATSTICTIQLPDNLQACAIRVSCVGRRTSASTAESWYGLIGFGSNGLVITPTATDTVLTSEIALGAGMADPIISVIHSGTTAEVKLTTGAAYTGYYLTLDCAFYRSGASKTEITIP